MTRHRILTVAAAALAALAGCYSPAAVPCGDGYCAAGTVCVVDPGDHPSTCAWPGDACNSVREGDACVQGDGFPAICVGGACVTRGCGDRVVSSGEACDDGAGNSDDVPGACRTTCVAPTCGDGVSDPDEGPGCFAGVREAALGPVEDIVAGDFDGDGRRDWLVLPPSGQRARVVLDALAGGAAGLEVPFDRPAGQAPPRERGLACDLDGDGDDEIVVLEARGLASFDVVGGVIVVDATLDRDLAGAHTACVDPGLDGHADLITGTPGQLALADMFRKGDGWAVTDVTVPAPLADFAVELADDGFVMLVAHVIEPEGESLYLLGLDGQVLVPVAGPLLGHITSLAVGRFAGLNAQDTAWTIEGSHQVTVSQSTNGVPEDFRLIGGVSTASPRLAPALLDDDNVRELVVYGGGAAPQVVRALFDSTLPLSAYAGGGDRLVDLDGDGFLDDVTPGEPLRWRPGGDGPFARGQVLAPGSRLAHAADLDGDVYPDLILASNDVFARHGHPSGLKPTAKMPNNAFILVAMVVADADGDGDDDAIYIDQTLESRFLSVVENVRGAETPNFPPNVVVGYKGSEDLRAANFDASTPADELVRCGGGSVELSLHPLVDDDWHAVTPASAGCTSVDVADVDGDFQADLIVTSTSTQIYRGHGDGTFADAELVELSAPALETSVYVDASGQVWLALVTTGGKVVARALGPDSHAELSLPGVHAGARFPVLLDADGDGADDLVFATIDSGGIDEAQLWFAHGGVDAFAPPVRFGRVEAITGLFAVDIGHDGRDDVIASGVDARVWRGRARP